ncbi:MAG: hypothetical protein ABLT11_09995 [Candidatus Acidiferrum sp.]
MARYSAFLGLQVEVQYRAGDILLPASGTFVGDTGRSIFLEQSFEQRGQHRQFRWEIPYQYVVRLSKKGNLATPAPLEMHEANLPSQLSPDQNIQQAAETISADADEEEPEPESAAAAVAGCGSNVSVIFPRPQRSNS